MFDIEYFLFGDFGVWFYMWVLTTLIAVYFIFGGFRDE